MAQNRFSNKICDVTIEEYNSSNRVTKKMENTVSDALLKDADSNVVNCNFSVEEPVLNDKESTIILTCEEISNDTFLQNSAQQCHFVPDNVQSITSALISSISEDTESECVSSKSCDVLPENTLSEIKNILPENTLSKLKNVSPENTPQKNNLSENTTQKINTSPENTPKIISISFENTPQKINTCPENTPQKINACPENTPQKINSCPENSPQKINSCPENTPQKIINTSPENTPIKINTSSENHSSLQNDSPNCTTSLDSSLNSLVKNNVPGSYVLEGEEEFQLSDISSNQSLSASTEHEYSIEDSIILKRANDHIKDLETRNASLESVVAELRLKMHAQELGFKQAELENKAEFLNRIEKLTKENNTLRKEKETIVVRYANSEKEVIMEKKAQQELEKKMKEMNKERENLFSKIKNMSAENNRLASSCEAKMIEIAKLQKNCDKLNADFNSREIRIKWLQNKLVNETGSHQETQTKLDQTLHRLNEMKEEAEQVRRDCQEMIKCYQEAEEIKSVKLDSQLKLKLSELEVHKQEKSDQEQVYHLLRQELEALKKKQRSTMEENNTLTLKIQNLEQERLEYEQNLSKLKDTQNLLKQEIVDLTARLAEMETLQLQLEREKEKSAASLREVERLRLTNAELQADMNACHIKEGELLKFTEGVTDTNVKLQSAHSLLEVRAQALEDELTETKKALNDVQQKYQVLVPEMESLKSDHEEEVQLLARKLAEKTRSVEKLNTKLDEAENENRVLKRRHIASIKELSRELHECKRRLDGYESSNGIRTESASLGSRSSSTASLDVMNSNDGRLNAISPPPVNFTEIKSSPKPPPENTSSDMPEIDKEMLIERIIKLQKTLAKKNDKIDFLEDHIVQLVKEMRKKTKGVDFKTV